MSRAVSTELYWKCWQIVMSCVVSTELYWKCQILVWIIYKKNQEHFIVFSFSYVWWDCWYISFLEVNARVVVAMWINYSFSLLSLLLYLALTSDLLYLQADSKPTAQLLESIIFVIDAVIPLIRKPPQTVVEELEQDLKNMIVRHSFLTVVHACIR
jgi:hypothetical protein